jgi:hypothetical protein
MAKIGPWLPSKYTIADIASIQALSRGEADEFQQKRALNFIIETLARTYDEQYYPDSSRDTDYALGMRKVGQQIVKCLKLDLATFKKKEEAKLPALQTIKGSENG